MTTLARRDDRELTAGFATWCAHRWPEASHEVVELTRPNSGWANETLLITTSSRTGPEQAQPTIPSARHNREPHAHATMEHRERLVVRLPPTLATWPSYDLAAQARVLGALEPSNVPVPRVVALEDNPKWLGAPFLVMSYEPGRAGAEVPAFDPWLVEAPVEEQRRLHEAFVTMLASIHRFEWRAAELERVLRTSEHSIAGEIGWWSKYIAWAADGVPTRALADAIAWCATTAPAPRAAASLCWGDPRIGNVLFADDRSITAVLDWELATIGPAEMDLAWYLALDDLTTFFTKRTVAGFLDRTELIAVYERELGREVHDLAWHEIFALTRSVAINERQARLAATTGIAYPGVAGPDNPVLGHLTRKIAEHDG